MTPEQLERRRSVIGASEVGLLFGLPSFGGRTLSDLWFEKKYGTLPSKGNRSTDLGNKLEPIVLEAAERQLGKPVVDRQLWVCNGSNAATLDGRIETGELVEAKTSGILWKTSDEWGEDGSDEVPETYLLQVQAQLLVTKSELAYLAALIGQRGFAMFQIKPHEGFQNAIAIRSAAFLQTVLEADSVDVGMDFFRAQFPTVTNEPPQLDTLKRLKRQPKKILDRSDSFDELFARFESAKANAKVADEAKELLQRQIVAALGDAEAAEVEGGRVTYFEQHKKESVQAASTYRVLRFTKGKA